MKRDCDFDMLTRIQPELEAIHARLENWAAWSRDRFRKNHCASAEWRWRPGDVHQEDRGPRDMWDSLDAEKVFNAIRGMPHKWRCLLHEHYIHKPPIMVICRKLAIRKDTLPDELNRARVMLENRLKM